MEPQIYYRAAVCESSLTFAKRGSTPVRKTDPRVSESELSPAAECDVHTTTHTFILHLYELVYCQEERGGTETTVQHCVLTFVTVKLSQS